MQFSLSKYTYIEKSNPEHVSVILGNRLNNKRVKLDNLSSDILKLIMDNGVVEQSVLQKNTSLMKLYELGFLCSETENEVESYYQKPNLDKPVPPFINAPLYTPAGNPDAVIFGIPYNKNSKIQDQTHLAPGEIRKMSTKVQYQAGLDGKMKGIRDSYMNRELLVDKAIADAGNLSIHPGIEYQLFNRKMKALLGSFKTVQTIPLFLGGNHSITAAAINALNRPVSLIHVDAHLDNDVLTPSVGVTHTNFISQLYAINSVKEIYSIGIRGYGEQNADRKHHVYKAYEWIENGPGSFIDQIDTQQLYYLSIDIDVLDPLYAPGVTYGEPFGVSPADLIRLINMLGDRLQFIGGDLVEYNPEQDLNNRTSALSVYLFLTLIDALT